MAEKLKNTLFYIIIFLLPLNIGYHFIINDAYINGLLIDYLIPTIYIQDILVSIFLFMNVKELFKSRDKYVTWFLFSVLLATWSSTFFISSLASFTRLVLYVGFMVVVKSKFSGKDYFDRAVTVFGVTTVLLSVLAICQWVNQGSVFNNYLLFGEQPYTVSTPGINIENFFGHARVPPYATFRHPNILGALLSIVLLWFLEKTKVNKIFVVPFVIGLVALFLSLSKFAWISFLIGLAYFLANKLNKEKIKTLTLRFVAVSIAASLFLPFLSGPKSLLEKPSFYRRADLLDSSYKLISKKPLFGVGYGISTAYIDKYLPPKHDVRFAQPPHNMFVLLFAEAGIFAVSFFSLYLFKMLRKASENSVFLISMMQILFLGVFDHYFFTIHQPQLLFWLILGFI